jgi:hypothetical protein
VAVAAAGALFLTVATAEAVDIQVGSANVPPASEEGTGTLTVSLDPDGDGVVATLNDLRFPDDPAGDTQNVSVAPRMITATLAAAIEATSLEIPLGAGQAAPLPSFGVIEIGDETISYSEKNGDTLIVPEGGRGENAMGYPAGTAIDAPTTVPDCVMDPGLSGEGSPMKDVVFAYLPDQCVPRAETCSAASGCDPETETCCCVGVRAIMIALDNLSEITDSRPIYSCQFEASVEEGMFDVLCPDSRACTSNEQCDAGDTCDTTEGVCVPAEPFQAAQAGDSPLAPGNIGNLPTACAKGVVNVGQRCIGDQDNGGSVTSDEATRAVLAFVRRDVTQNPAADGDNSGGVDSAEATRSVLNFIRRQCTP